MKEKITKKIAIIIAIIIVLLVIALIILNSEKTNKFGKTSLSEEIVEKMNKDRKSVV